MFEVIDWAIYAPYTIWQEILASIQAGEPVIGEF